MEEWKEYKLGDISEIQTGPFGSQLHQSDYVEKGTPCIMPTNIGSQLDIKTNGIAHVKDEDVARLHRHCVKVGDIIYSRRGDIEKCAYINQHEEGWLCGTGCLRIRVNAEKATPHFVAYQLATKTCKRWVVNNAVGTTMPNLNTGILKELPLLLPPMDVQMQSVSVLSALDDKIAVNRRICENLEAQAQALFKHWFIDFAPFKNGKFVESELGMIPEGWRVGSFSEIFDLGPGGTPKTSEKAFWEDGTIPFFSPKDVNGVYCFETEKHITEKGLNSCSSRLYEKNTVFITCRGTVGKIAMAAIPMAMNQSNYAILSNKGYSQYFAYLMTTSIVKRLKFKANGAVFDAITSKDFKEQIIIPQLNIVNRFNPIIQSIFDSILNLGFENLRLSTLRDALLPKLMSGQIKV